MFPPYSITHLPIVPPTKLIVNWLTSACSSNGLPPTLPSSASGVAFACSRDHSGDPVRLLTPA
jgi:hypothetical protein